MWRFLLFDGLSDVHTIHALAQQQVAVGVIPTRKPPTHMLQITFHLPRAITPHTPTEPPVHLTSAPIAYGAQLPSQPHALQWRGGGSVGAVVVEWVEAYGGSVGWSVVLVWTVT